MAQKCIIIRCKYVLLKKNLSPIPPIKRKMIRKNIYYHQNLIINYHLLLIIILII